MASDKTNNEIENSESLEDDLYAVSFPKFEDVETDALIEEVNVLDLEGYLFSFSPQRESLVGEQRYELRNGRELVLDFHPKYGQPSLLAYRVLQGVFKKITDEGPVSQDDGSFIYDDKVAFSQRELARIIGLKNFGGEQTRDLYRAIQQLRMTDIQAHMYDKKTGEYSKLMFTMFPAVLLAGKQNKIHSCSIQVAEPVINSLNNRHWACFNWEKLKTLKPIQMALFKRVYRHMSNLYGHQLKGLDKRNAVTAANILEARKSVVFEKSYTDICSEWLGGIKAWETKSQIIQKHGGHLDALKKLKLIRSWSVEPMAKKSRGSGFKIVFRPGMGFFRDYELFYMSNWQPQLRFQATSDLVNIQQPLDVLAEFYRRLTKSDSINKTVFPVSQNELARELIDRYGFDEVMDLIDYTITEAPKTKFEIKSFGAVKTYIQAWESAKSARLKAKVSKAKKDQAEAQNRLRGSFERYERATVNQYKESLSASDFDVYQSRAEELYDEQHPGEDPQFRNVGVKLKLDVLLRADADILSFEAWVASRKG